MMPPIRPVISVIVALVGSSVYSTAPASSTRELLSQLQARERRLENLTVSGETWDEVSDDQGLTWRRDKVSESVTAWYDGMAGGPARVDVHHQVTRWMQGKAPYYEASYILAFDGQSGRRVNFTGGALGHEAKMPTGLLLPTSPEDLPMQGFAAGTFYSIYYYGRVSSISQFLDGYLRDVLARDPTVPVKVSQEKFDDIETVRITLGAPDKGWENWWFDLKRGLSLLCYRHSNLLPVGRTVCYLEARIVDLAKVGPELWYPHEAYTYEGWYPSEANYFLGRPRAENEPRRRQHYKASKIIANDPNFDRKVFSVQFPPDYLVTDRAHNGVYRVAPAPQKLDIELDQLLNQAKATTQLAGPPDPPDRLEGAPGVVMSPTRTNGRALPVVLAIVGAILAVLAVLLARHGRRAAHLSVLLTFGVFGAAICSGANTSDDATDVGNSTGYHVNCSVNVGYTTVRYFDIDTSVSEIGALLHAGGAFERACTLADLKNCFEHKGLTVRALKATDAGQLLHYAEPGVVMVVRIKTEYSLGDPDAHFFDVIGVRGGIVILDPPSTSRLVHLQDIGAEGWTRSFTGEFLVISKGSRSGQPQIALDSAEVDLGTISPTARQAVAEIGFRNSGERELRILSVKGPCSCFMGSSGNLRLPSGARGVIKATFDPKLLSVGRGERLINLATNDPNHEVVTVKVRYTLEAGNIPGDVRVSPSLIAYGRVPSAGSVTSRPAEIQVFIPAVVTNASATLTAMTTSSYLRIELVSDVMHSEPGAAAERVVTYRALWQRRPEGPFEEKIVFKLSDPGKPQREFEALLRGDVTSDIRADAAASNSPIR